MFNSSNPITLERLLATGHKKFVECSHRLDNCPCPITALIGSDIVSASKASQALRKLLPYVRGFQDRWDDPNLRPLSNDYEYLAGVNDAAKIKEYFDSDGLFAEYKG